MTKHFLRLVVAQNWILKTFVWVRRWGIQWFNLCDLLCSAVSKRLILQLVNLVQVETWEMLQVTRLHCIILVQRLEKESSVLQMTEEGIQNKGAAYSITLQIEELKMLCRSEWLISGLRTLSKCNRLATRLITELKCCYQDRLDENITPRIFKESTMRMSGK